MLSAQSNLGVTGDLLEIGAYFGKSAIALGIHAAPEETVHICDLFEQEAVDDANSAENNFSYPGLARKHFEANYRSFVDRDPHIIQELSTSIAKHIDPGTIRFAHIDGGHLFETVADDLRNVRALLGPKGLVVLDDFRALHTPGVAAAAWAEVSKGGLIPLALSEQKMYASWGPIDDYARYLDSWLEKNPDFDNHGFQEIAGHPVLILQNPPEPIVQTTGSRIRRWMPIMPPAVEDYFFRNQLGTYKPYLGLPTRPGQPGGD